MIRMRIPAIQEKGVRVVAFANALSSLPQHTFLVNGVIYGIGLGHANDENTVTESHSS